MNNIDPVLLVTVLIFAFVLLIVLLVILRRIFVNVGAREIAIKERRYLGAGCRPDASSRPKAKLAFRQTCSSPACT